MNANPVSSLTAIFVVMLSSGQYSDRHSKPIQSFATKEEADRFVTSKDGEVRRLEGMQDAITAMHSDWQKVNPQPSDDCEDRGVAWEAWHNFNSIELDRLETVTGFREACKGAGLSPNDDVSYIGYYVEEVPFKG